MIPAPVTAPPKPVLEYSLDPVTLYWIEMEKRAPAREAERKHICEIAKRALAVNVVRDSNGKKRGNMRVQVDRREK